MAAEKAFLLSPIPNSILVIDEALDPFECQYLAEGYCMMGHLLRPDAANPFWDKRVLAADDVKHRHPTFAGHMERASLDIGLRIQEKYGLPVWCDFVHLVGWKAGDGMPVHADRCNLDGSSNNLGWRDFGSVLYLTDDYQGGEIYFEQFGIDIKPHAGLLIAFPGDIVHRHGVRPLRGGTKTPPRVTMPGFWTTDPDKPWLSGAK